MAEVRDLVNDACSKAAKRHPEVCEAGLHKFFIYINAVERFTVEFLSRVAEKPSPKKPTETITDAQIKEFEKEAHWNEDQDVQTLIKHQKQEERNFDSSNNDLPSLCETAENLVFDV